MTSTNRRRSLTKSAKKVAFPGKQWNNLCTRTSTSGMVSKTWLLSGPQQSLLASSNIKKKITMWHFSEKFCALNAMKSLDSSSKPSKRQSLLFWGLFSARSSLRKLKTPWYQWLTTFWAARDSLKIGSGAESSKKCTMRMTTDYLKVNSIRSLWHSRLRCNRTRARSLTDKWVGGFAHRVQIWWLARGRLGVHKCPALWWTTLKTWLRPVNSSSPSSSSAC